jgi:hypothetical protein
MITHNEYIKMTSGRKPITVIDNHYYRCEDYIIDNKLIRFSCMRIVNKETLAHEDSNHVHYNDMGNYV